MKQKLLRLFGMTTEQRLTKAFKSQRLDFYADLSRALSSKEELGDWLRKSSIRMKKNQPLVASAYQKIHEIYVEKGLVDSLTGYVPANELTVIAASEASGSLPENLRFLAETTKKREKLSAVMSAVVAMSSITVGLALYNVWMIAGSIMPMMGSVGAKPESLSGVAFFTYWMSYWVYHLGPVVAIASLVAGVLVFKGIHTWTGPRRRKLDKSFIVFRMYQEFESAMFMLSFATLKSSKIGDREAIQKIAKTSSAWLKWHCNLMHNRIVQHGMGASAFSTGLFSARISDRLTDLCERGSFDSAVREIGQDVLDSTIDYLMATANRMEIYIAAVSTGILLLITFAVPPIIEEVAKGITTNIR